MITPHITPADLEALKSHTVLVTGGAGFIGSHLCHFLVSNGIKVISIDNFDAYYDESIKHGNLARIKAVCPDFINLNVDFTDAEALKKALQPYEGSITLLVHLAAKAGVRPSLDDPEGYINTNVNGTLNLMQWCVAQHVKKVVFASSSSVYGARNNSPFSEDDDISKPVSPYAATKAMGEALLHTYSHLYGINISCLRFFTVYGPAQRPDLAIHKFSKLMAKNQPIVVYGDGSFRRDFTHVADILQGIVASMAYTKTPFEVFNLGESATTTVLELIAQLETALGLKANIQFAPENPGDVPLTCADISKAKRLLNYQPQLPVAIGLKDFAQWFLNNQSLVASP